MAKVLYINNKQKKCGVYEFGRLVGGAVVQSKKHCFLYFECDSWDEYLEVYNREKPNVVFYNYISLTMPWIVGKKHLLEAIQLGMVHEVYQEFADLLDDTLFDYHVAADPTLILRNPLVYKTGRLVPPYAANPPLNKVPTVGSFGFATNGKGFERILDEVQNEFDQAHLRFSISYSTYLDQDGALARSLAESLKKRLTKEGVTLSVAHDHLEEQELLDFLAGNDLNAFFYDYQMGRGISSAIDWALAVKRPIAVTKSSMFRHLATVYPSIFIEDRSVREIMDDQGHQLEELRQEWSKENLIWEYERITDDVLRRGKNRNSIFQLIKKIKIMGKPLGVILPHAILRVSPWISVQDKVEFAGFSSETYVPFEIEHPVWNCILDDKMRIKYRPATEFLKRIVPDTMARKIPESTIQQSFVFDTAVRFASKIGTDKCRVLAVGAFEDTAALALRTLGYHIDMIDPNLNYSLATFLTKPNVALESYDVIISTSVIEHVQEDEAFVRDISKLLKRGGVAILTCDFHNDYVKGFAIPNVDYRFYTKNDLSVRLMRAIPECELYGVAPKWDCTEYDFCYMRKYHYTFASFVFTKSR
jgi:SAM-dependent methyltransferase